MVADDLEHLKMSKPTHPPRGQEKEEHDTAAEREREREREREAANLLGK